MRGVECDWNWCDSRRFRHFLFRVSFYRPQQSRLCRVAVTWFLSVHLASLAPVDFSFIMRASLCATPSCSWALVRTLGHAGVRRTHKRVGSCVF